MPNLHSLLREIASDTSLTADQQNDLRYILAELMGVEKAKLILYTDQKLTPAQMEAWQEGKSRLLEGREPVHYIIGKKNFMGQDFYVDDRVLVPRFDTEILVEKSLEEARKLVESSGEIKILELCTGSGAIAISMLALWGEEKALKIDALDISPHALEVASINANKLLSQEKRGDLKLHQSDLFSNLKKDSFYSMLVANPPYISEEEYATLDPSVKKEPVLALLAQEDGLYFYRKILQEARDYLQPGAPIFFEIGYKQGQALKDLAKEYSYDSCQILRDYAGHPRVAIIR